MAYEEWRPVPGIGGWGYDVSSLGRIRARKTGKIRNSTIRGNGYRYIGLRDSPNGVSVSRTVHSIVCRAFHGTPEVKKEVRHLNGDPLNNHAENLAWGSRSENCADRVAHGVSNRGERHGMNRLTEEQVRMIRNDSRPRRLIAPEYGISDRYVDEIRSGGTWAWLTE